MASKGIVGRDQRRRELHAKYAGKRAELKEQLRKSWDNPQEVMRLQGELMKLPLNSSPTRLHNRPQGLPSRRHQIQLVSAPSKLLEGKSYESK